MPKLSTFAYISFKHLDSRIISDVFFTFTHVGDLLITQHGGISFNNSKSSELSCDTIKYRIN